MKTLLGLGRVWILILVCFQGNVIADQSRTDPSISSTYEYQILQRLWKAYLGGIPRSEVQDLLTKGWGDEIFNTRVGTQDWLKLVRNIEWLEYRKNTRWGSEPRSELIAKVRLPDGEDYRVAFIFQHQPQSRHFHDMYVSNILGEKENGWIIQNQNIVSRQRAALGALGERAKEICSITNDYASLSKKLAEFRHEASKSGVLDEPQVKEFLKQSEPMVIFGATWDQIVTKTNSDEFRQNFSEEFTKAVGVSLSKSGVKLEKSKEDTLKELISSEVKQQQASTIQRLSSAQAGRLEQIRTRMNNAYEELIQVLN